MYSFLEPGNLTKDQTTELLRKLDDKPRVCNWMLRVPWDYLAVKVYEKHIKSILYTHREGMELHKIEEKLKEKPELHDQVHKCVDGQLKHILWGLANKQIILHTDGVYKLPIDKGKGVLKDGASSSSENKINGPTASGCNTSLDIVKRIASHASAFHENVALKVDLKSYDYKDLITVASHISLLIFNYHKIVCRTLTNKNLKGTRICVVNTPSAEFVAAVIAIWSSGCVAVPVAHNWKEDELLRVMADADVSMILSTQYHSIQMQDIANRSRAGFSLIREVPTRYVTDGVHSMEIRLLNPVKDYDPALILYASGTTAKPRGVVHTHSSILNQVNMLSTTWRYTSSDCFLHCLPLHHAYGLFNALIAPLYAGSMVEFMPYPNGKDIWKRWRESYREDGTKLPDGITVFTGVPTFYKELINAHDNMDLNLQAASAFAGSQLRLMICGSWGLSPPDMDKWENITGQRPLEVYGMTEFGMAIANPVDGSRTQGTVGTPLPGVHVKILADGDGPGELCVKSPSMFKEYWKLPEVYKESFTNDFYFRTGDVAKVNGDGKYEILGCTNADIIKVRGSKFSALEIEAILLGHPAISECCVFGLPHETYGEEVIALVVLDLKQQPAATMEKIRMEVKARLRELKIARIKRPTEYFERESLPRDATRKVNKKQLKTEYAAKGKAKLDNM